MAKMQIVDDDIAICHSLNEWLEAVALKVALESEGFMPRFSSPYYAASDKTSSSLLRFRHRSRLHVVA